MPDHHAEINVAQARTEQEVARALNHLGRALHAIRLYGNKHPTVSNQLTEAANAVRRAVSNGDSIAIRVGSNEVIFNDEPLADAVDAQSLANTLHRLDIAGVTIEAAATAATFQQFLEILLHAQISHLAGQELADELHHCGVGAISLTPIRFDALTIDNRASESKIDNLAVKLDWNELTRAIWEPPRDHSEHMRG